jgi:3-polyprenyl-4-hydroxybenzoate decarboxylase
MPRIFVLDDDIDPANTAELGWALATRVHPTARRITENYPIVPLIACYTDDERHHAQGDHVIFDALQPAPGERWRRSGFNHIYPEDVRRRVLAAWPI